jgi:dihydrofolate reductase
MEKPTAKLILQMQSTLDGFVARPDGSLDWAVWNFSDSWTWDPELQGEFNAILAGIDAIVLSGHMGAEGFIDHWTGIGRKHAGDARFNFARTITSVPKFIFSDTLKKASWEDTAIVSGDLKERLNALKAERGEGKTLITFGGARFAAALLEAGLVDELQLFVNPAVIGEGLSIFEGLSLKPRLLGARAYPCGVSVLKYAL